MQELSFDKQILIALNEIYARRRLCAVSFAIISMIVVSVGLVWPKTYKSSTTILWNKSQVVKPLLEGTAVTSTGKEQSQIAKEVIYSNRNLEELIETAELNRTESGRLMTDKEIELLKYELRKKIVIERGSNNILRISYKSSDPRQAYLVVSLVSKLFIEETTSNSRADSLEAYNFIQNQVLEYQEKLNKINKSINDFKSENLEIQVNTAEAVNSRINSLSDQIKTTELQLKEARIKRDSLVEQLALESQKNTQEKVVTVKNERLQELESKLSSLRLSYTETYPDIIQLKDQIRALKESLAEGAEQRPAQDEDAKSNSPGNYKSALAERLKLQIADQETVIKTLEARKQDQQNRFEQEIARSSKVNRVVSKLEELARDREVTKQLYDRLLTRLENARVSLNLEKESAASLFKIQEPPIVPLVPEGLRFLHFAIGSVILGAGLPLGFIVGILFIDPRIRHEEALDLNNDIPVLGSVPSFNTRLELRKQKFATVQSVILVTISLILVAVLSLSRYYEVI
ncbi:MAG: hypothetical protein PVJ78_03600 [Gammaproteobacteria bacterium]|jgi:polysaccharide chain length determinant protein (PEP-CTERM system associated)